MSFKDTRFDIGLPWRLASIRVWRQSAQVSSGRSGRRAGLRSRAGVGGDAGKAEIWGKLVRETLGGPADTAEQPAALGEVGETGGGGGRY